MATVLGPKDPTVAFQMDGSGALFYEARLRYARKEPPHDEIDRGFFVRKLVRAVTPGHYVSPPATIEDMYRPDRFGRTAYGAIDIAAPK